MNRVLFSSLTLIVAAVPAVFAADWMQFRGPHGNAVSTDTGLPEKWSERENVLWKTKLPWLRHLQPDHRGRLHLRHVL